MSKFTERYTTNKEAEEEGVWVDLGDGIEIKVRRIKSPTSRKVLRQLQAPYEHMRRTGRSLPESVETEITRKWAAHGLLVDWKGVGDKDGKNLPFSPDNALKVLQEFDDFADDVAYFAREVETFRAKSLEDAAKN
jgi:hypothetical protein